MRFSHSLMLCGIQRRLLVCVTCGFRCATHSTSQATSRFERAPVTALNTWKLFELVVMTGYDGAVSWNGIKAIPLAGTLVASPALAYPVCCPTLVP